jgi:hypothetical protein
VDNNESNSNADKLNTAAAKTKGTYYIFRVFMRNPGKVNLN